MEDQHIQQYELFLKEQLGDILEKLPTGMIIPLDYETEHGDEEVVFIAKCKPDQYSKISHQDNNQTLPLSVAMDVTTTEFNFGITVDSLTLRVQMTLDRADKLLQSLYAQRTFTYILLDHEQLNIVWMTNQANFDALRHHYEEIFQFFGIPQSEYENKLRIVVVPPNQRGFVSYIEADQNIQSNQIAHVIGGDAEIRAQQSYVVITNRLEEGSVSPNSERLVDNQCAFIVAAGDESKLRSLSIQEALAILTSI